MESGFIDKEVGFKEREDDPDIENRLEGEIFGGDDRYY